MTMEMRMCLSMKMLKWVTLLAALVLLLAPAAMAGDEIVASVGGIPVTRYELKRQISRILPLNSSYHGGVSQEKMAEIKEKALDELIEQTLKVRYALDNEIVVPAADLEARLKPVWEKFPTPETLEKVLEGEEVSALRASVYRSLLAKKAEEIAVAREVKVSDEEVESYYQDNKEKYFRPRMFKASQIFIKVDPRLSDEERQPFLKKAQDLAQKGKAGEDFYNLAYYNSDDDKRYVGGDLGYFHEGQLIADIERAILTMKAGEVSEPVESIYGYHVLKLVEIKEPVQLTLDEKRDEIRKNLEKEHYEKLYQAWITPLKNTYEVKRF